MMQESVKNQSAAQADLEIELTFLARNLPDTSKATRRTSIVDYYFPLDPAVHPRLRLRNNGGFCTITSKMPAAGSDASVHTESTIPISDAEFSDLVACSHRSVRKSRFEIMLGGRDAEVDVFEGPLAGLVLIDFEFRSTEDRDSFVAPDVCLADVTQEDFIAGGLLAGKEYTDLEPHLREFGYEKI